MIKTTLKFELDLDFALVAITAQLRDYMLCYKINRQLGTDFCKDSDLEIIFNGGQEEVYFSRYHCVLPEAQTEAYIVANKGSEGFLIPEMRTVDFFLLIRNFIDTEDLKSVITGINKIADVLVAAEVDPKKLKSKENLIF